MRVSNWFVALVALFVACLIASNIIAVKLVVIFGFRDVALTSVNEPQVAEDPTLRGLRLRRTTGFQ